MITFKIKDWWRAFWDWFDGKKEHEADTRMIEYTIALAKAINDAKPNAEKVKP